MATEPIPKFWGQIVVSSSNNTLDFWETSVTDSSITVDSGTYWPHDLATEIQTKLNAVVSGWTVSVSDTTGLLTIARGSGWYPKITASESNKLLTGGDTNVDTESALATGERAPEHCGFVQDASYPSAATSHTADTTMHGCWFPTEPPAEDPYYKLQKQVRVSSTAQGTLYHADYTGRGKGIEQRTLRFEYQLETSRYIAAVDWWKWYASEGGLIRYFPDREDNTAYKEYKLPEEDCNREPWDRQQMGYYWYSGSFTLQRQTWG
tara:strand:+ start:2309 stop:3100 length:792 start_codon:yes stop_codon:yes gene_type:complete